MKKNMKGISLIVLIVTIIVMIIIAGAIIISLSEANIIDQAESATSDYNLKVEKEKIQLALNEWLLEKNTSSNAKTFKAFMTEALPDDTVSGVDAGPITIQINDTKNTYSVTENGEITAIEVKEITALEKYLFGEDMQGKEFFSIVSESEENKLTGLDFIDDESTEINERDVLELVSYENGEIKKETDDGVIFNMIFYITDTTEANNIKLYKFECETNSEYYITQPSRGLIIYGESAKYNGTRVGKVISYDNKLWTIMYDDETNGLQMVCNQAQLYNGSEFRLGSNTSSITDWNVLLTEADLDNSGDLTDFEKAAYSYNNVVDILNAACESLVPTNSNILDVRSLGSNPVDKELENETLYTSELLASLPENNDTYSPGFINGKLKSSDANHRTDFDTIRNIYAFNMYNIDNLFYNDGDKTRGIFMASRIIYEFSPDKELYVGVWELNHDFSFSDDTWFNVRQSSVNAGSITGTLLPVVKLNPNVEFSGAGTVASPYTF